MKQIRIWCDTPGKFRFAQELLIEKGARWSRHNLEIREPPSRTGALLVTDKEGCFRHSPDRSIMVSWLEGVPEISLGELAVMVENDEL